MKINNINFDCTMEEVLEKLQAELRHRGSPLLSSYKRSKGFLMVPCVYHGNGVENHPSAEFADDGSYYYCFTCKETHSTPDVITHCLHENGWNWLRKNFLNQKVIERDVKFDLSRKKKVEKEEYIDKKELEKYRYMHEYILNRGISKEIIRKFDIGYDKKNDCITFPNKDTNGNILFVATRHTKKKRFNYPAGVKKPLYGIYELHRELKKGTKIDELYVTESMINCLTLWSWGKYAVALNGTGSTSQYKELKNLPCRKLILALDPDNAGQVGTQKIKKAVTNKLLYELPIPPGKDINDLSYEEFKSLKERLL